MTAEVNEMSMNDDELTNLIRSQATRYKAGSRLRAEVCTRVALEDAAHPTVMATHEPARAFRGRWHEFGWRSALVGFAVGVVLSLGLMVPAWKWAADLTHPVSEELVSDHVRSLRVGPLIQVASSDRHTVKPWFQGKLDFAPLVLNLAEAGFSLQGARIEQMDGNAVAVLVYTHNQHIVSLYVWPSNSPQATQRLQHKGFNLLQWSDGGMHYWLVSDMDGSAVERFGHAWLAVKASLQ